MEIILLNDGQGICRPETAEIKNGRLHLHFIGVPPYSTVSIISGGQSIRRTLSSNGESEINISQTSGEIKFLIVSKNKIWHCDSIYIERDDSGNVRVISQLNYPKKFEMLFEEVYTLKKEISEIREQINRFNKEVERIKTEYQIV